MSKVTKEQTLAILRANNIEPDLDFLNDFSKFSIKKQYKLIKLFKKFPDITSRYKWINGSKL